jgi:hypothetical protein
LDREDSGGEASTELPRPAEHDVTPDAGQRLPPTSAGPGAVGSAPAATLWAPHLVSEGGTGPAAGVSYALSGPAELTASDGSVLEVREVGGPQGRFAEALTEVLGDDASGLPGLVRAPGEPISDALRRGLASEVTEDDLDPGGPVPGSGVWVTLRALETAGVVLGEAERVQADLLGGVVSLDEAGLTPVERMAVLLGLPVHWDDEVTRVAASVAGRMLPAGLVVFDAASGEVRRFGPVVGTDASPAVLVLDDGRFQAAVPRPPGSVPAHA